VEKRKKHSIIYEEIFFGVPSFGAHIQHGQSIENGQVNSFVNLAMQRVMLLLDHFLALALVVHHLFF
jgi:hypothetical protein